MARNVALLSLAGAAWGQTTYYVDDSKGVGRVFDGIGGLSGGGATTRLLPSYDAAVQSDILDYLFTPSFGASLHICKVEIGSDAQSTDGSETSSMHGPWDENYNVGYEGWLMVEAKKRNPAVKLYGLPWGFPQWVSCNPGTLQNCSGNPYTYPNQTATYISKWIAGMKNTFNLDIDYVGIWNERQYDVTYIKTLRSVLDANGQAATRIVAPDSGWDIAKDILADPVLADAIYAIGAHYPGTTSSSEAQQTGKQLWASEDMSTYSNNVGAGCWSRVIMQNYVRGLMSASISWNLIASYAKGTNWYRASLMTALQPWSGAYSVDPLIWVSAHITQFTAPGWNLLINGTGAGTGSGLLASGGSYVTYQSPDGKDVTIVVEKMSRDHSPCVRPGLNPFLTSPEVATFKLSGSMTGITSLNLWTTHLAFTPGDNQVEFQPMGTVPVVNGIVTLNVSVDSMYTLSTITTAAHGSHAAPATPTTFPATWTDDYDDCAVGSEAAYLYDQNGAFECFYSGSPEHAVVIRQQTPLRPITWSGDLRPHSLIGHADLTDVSYYHDFFIEAPGATVVVGARAVGQDDASAILLCIDTLGNWNVTLRVSQMTSGPALAAGKLPVPIAAAEWHTLRLDVNGTAANAWIDGVAIFTSLNVSAGNSYGFAFMGTLNYGEYTQFDNIALYSTQTMCGGTTPAAGVPLSLVQCESEVGPAPGTKWSTSLPRASSRCVRTPRCASPRCPALLALHGRCSWPRATAGMCRRYGRRTTRSCTTASSLIQPPTRASTFSAAFPQLAPRQ